ncbi:MAG: glycine zipper family protein [Pseudomonadota bacterium]
MFAKQSVPLVMSLLILSPFTAHAQSTLASTMEVYVFPKSGQPAQAQSKAEAECYQWASTNTGTDPFELAKDLQQAEAEARQAQAEAQQDAKGSAVKGAARGAAAGAIVGEIADDSAGKGAATGAAVGGVRGRLKSRRNRRSTSEDTEQELQAAKVANAAEVEKFKKAFSVCLEAKDYLVKY